jgi:catechol 2,3-dioxygenase-like lactoylglutathione lyase family enzyme
VIDRMSHTCVWVLDQDSAKAFYIEKLGLELRGDVAMGPEFGVQVTDPEGRTSW